MWQKAMVKVSLKPEAIGKTLWVECGAPVMTRAISSWTGSLLPPEPRYRANLVAASGAPYSSVLADAVELLGGPDAFADDVPLMTWEEFING